MYCLRIVIFLLACIAFVNCEKDSTPVTPSQQNGAVRIVITKSSSCFVEVGLGYTSTDVINEAYFTRTNIYNSAAYHKGDLAPGIYYYKAKLVSTSSCIADPAKQKNGAVTVEPNKTTSVSVSLN